MYTEKHVIHKGIYKKRLLQGNEYYSNYRIFVANSASFLNLSC